MVSGTSLAVTRYEQGKQLSLKISQGYEYRETECVVQLSTPRPGVKTIIRADNGDWVAEEPMTHEEMQNRLFPATEAGADAKVQ